MSKLKGRRLSLFAWSALLLAACYSPDLTKQVFKCDRGKCPDGLYCTDGVYCTEATSECAVGGIEVSTNVAACVNAKDQNTLCSKDATTAKCDMMNVAKDLCAGITNCAYCCK